MLNHQKIRADFPILDKVIGDNKLVYLDSAATTHKPKQVIDCMYDFMLNHNGTVRRGVYDLSVHSTQLFDESRTKVQKFLNAEHPEEIIFTRGTTEALNMIAFCLTEAFKGELSPKSTLGKKSELYTEDEIEILVSGMEHHANLVPWQINAHRIGAGLKSIKITDNGELDLEDYKEKIKSSKVKVLAITHICNSLGTINPIKEIINEAHKHGVIVVIDGAQGAAHSTIDLQDLDADFYVFSGHKTYGPTGVGVLYGKKKILDELPPYHGGGEMIARVKLEETSFAALPFKFEAGTPAIAEVIGLGAALDYIQEFGLQELINYENELQRYCTQELEQIEGLKIIGQAKNKAAINSFVFDDIESYDTGTMLNQYGVAIRTGHHCAQPVMDRFGVSSTARISLAFYNNKEDIDKCIEVLKKVIGFFR